MTSNTLRYQKPRLVFLIETLMFQFNNGMLLQTFNNMFLLNSQILTTLFHLPIN